MPFIQYKCRTCLKSVTETDKFELKDVIVRKLSCGHSNIESKLVTNQFSYENFKSIDGKKLFPYQITGAKACEAANMNFLFADEMRLGKTIQILAVIKAHSEEVLPAAVICKSTLKSQWSMDIARWIGPLTPRFIVKSSKDLMPKVDFYIFSYDLLRRFNGALPETFKRLGVKTVIIDECQHIKNYKSQRAQEVISLCRNLQYKIAASGTPFENNASEYFPILNILKPSIFRTYAEFVRTWCDNYWTGYSYKICGIKNIKRFKELTKDFIIRRLRKDVELEFPDIMRTYQYYDIGADVKAAYAQTLKEFYDYSETTKDNIFERQTNELAYLAKMRHLTGLSKVKDVVDFTTDFLYSSERKLTIFTHHKDVGELLYQQLCKVIQDMNECMRANISPPLRLVAELESEERFNVVNEFQNKSCNRILIAGLLVAGEGLNLSACSDCVIMERHWNPIKEEQAESRFVNMFSTNSKINSNYPVVISSEGEPSVDEILAEIVERKRAQFSNVMNDTNVNWDESAIITELKTELSRRRNK